MTWESTILIPEFLHPIWIGVTPAEVVCDQFITLDDFMASCARITGAGLNEDDAEDSVSYLSLLKGNLDEPVRASAIHHSARGKFAVRKDDWVLIDSPSGDDNEEPEWFKEERGYVRHDLPGELYNLTEDLSERKNRYAEHPEVVGELKWILKSAKKEGHSNGAVNLPDDHFTE